MNLDLVTLERIADALEVHNTLYLAYLTMAFGDDTVNDVLNKLAEGEDDE